MVGGPGFEPGASRSRTVRAAKLRQPPTRVILDAYGREPFSAPGRVHPRPASAARFRPCPPPSPPRPASTVAGS